MSWGGRKPHGASSLAYSQNMDAQSGEFCKLSIKSCGTGDLGDNYLHWEANGSSLPPYSTPPKFFWEHIRLKRTLSTWCHLSQSVHQPGGGCAGHSGSMGWRSDRWASWAGIGGQEWEPLAAGSGRSEEGPWRGVTNEAARELLGEAGDPWWLKPKCLKMALEPLGVVGRLHRCHQRMTET